MSPDTPSPVGPNEISIDIYAGEGFEASDRLKAALSELAVALSEETEEDEVAGFAMAPMTPGAVGIDVMGPAGDAIKCFRIVSCGCKQSTKVRCTGVHTSAQMQRPGI